MLDFNPRHWFYLADDGRVFSCSRCEIVAKDDPAYAAFLVAPAEPLPWPKDAAGAQTDAALDAALAPLRLSTSGPVREATSYDLVAALTDDEVAALGKAKAKDQHLFGKRNDAWPESNPKIKRFADVLGTTPKAWFDRVFAPAS